MSCNKKIADALGHDCWVDYEIEAIYDSHTQAQTNPPFLTLRKPIEGLKEICGDGTWADGTPIKVGVGDTGIDQTHVRNGELGKVTNKNFTSDRSEWDINGHGTHVAGHIGARNNEQAIQGLASQCELFTAKVLGGRQGSGATSWINNGVRWLADSGCKIINLSLGGGGFDSTSAALYKALDEAGILVFAAAGNAGQGGERGGYPARYNETASITAIDYNKKIASFSSETRSANLTGYGVGIDSLWINGRRASISGTSMATPDQVGIATLLLGYFDRLGVKVKNKEHYLELVRPGLQDLGIPGRDTFFGEGFIDIWKVIEHHGLPSDKPKDPVEPPVCEQPKILFEFDILGKNYAIVEL